MKESARARVAAIVGAVVNNNSVSYVYDYSINSHRNISITFEGSYISGYDYDTSTHFSGGRLGSLDFYDYETSSHVHLKIEDNNFTGYDYYTDSHFSGTINGKTISFYEYETNKYYNFSV